MRLYLGLGLMGNAALALTFSDRLEGLLGVKPSQRDEQRLLETLPRVVAIERNREDGQEHVGRG